MARSIDQILADERIDISERLIRTPTTTVRVGDSWCLWEYHWPRLGAGFAPYPVNPFAVATFIASIGLLSRVIPPDMPWLVPIAFGAAIGAGFSIGRSLTSRWLAPTKEVEKSEVRGISFSAGDEGGTTIFQSSDEQEIKLFREKLEQTLLPAH